MQKGVHKWQAWASSSLLKITTMALNDNRIESQDLELYTVEVK